MDFHLAQLNIGRLLHPLDHPQIHLWWVRQGHAHGASPHAFWFGKLLPAPEVSVAPV
jgi:hypothetical protein